jgi:KDO2-lipid IV(A) lauroyltransferase
MSEPPPAAARPSPVPPSPTRPRPPREEAEADGWAERLLGGVLAGAMRGALRLPYERRVRLAGALARGVLAPLAGYHRRSRRNLALILPELGPDRHHRIARAAADNAGRTLMEIFSGPEFVARARAARAEGEGLEAIRAARAAGRPVILASGHLGNYDVPRGFLSGEGIAVGGLYKPLGNAAFNAAYVRAIGGIAGPVFPRDRRGLGRMVAFLKGGGVLGFLSDQRMLRGEALDFLGRPALTALSAAELALKYGALLVPVYGIREPDGLSFRFVAEAPIPHSDARSMMQAVNDSLAAQVRAHPGQYFWIHRRWRLARRDGQVSGGRRRR